LNQEHPQYSSSTPAIHELADPSMLDERFDPAVVAANTQARLAALQAGGGDDEETLLNVLCAPTTPNCSSPWHATWKGA
jgi:hypothetical protein